MLVVSACGAMVLASPDGAADPPRSRALRSEVSTQRLRITTGLPFDERDLPEVVGQILVQQIRVGHREVSFDAPSDTPRVPHSKTVLAVFVTDSKNCVTTDNSFPRSRHR